MNRTSFLGLALLAVLITTCPAQTPSPAGPDTPPTPAPFQKLVFVDPKNPTNTITLTSPTECEYTTSAETLNGTYIEEPEHLTLTLNDNGKPRVLKFILATVLAGEDDHNTYISAAFFQTMQAMIAKALAGHENDQAINHVTTPTDDNFPLLSKALARAKENAKLQTAHNLYLGLFQYAIDNNGDYPTGKSSTEIFQKLIDGGYITDPALFYFDMPGKVKPTSNTLKPENVCWDFTSPVNDDTSDEVPVVFITGFKLNYQKGGGATLLAKITPSDAPFVVTYKSGSSKVIHTGDDGTVPGLISDKFTNPKNQAYIQLTPDGPLTP